jgi:hypothetical protein
MANTTLADGRVSQSKAAVAERRNKTNTRKYYEANKERVKAKSAKWRAENQARVANYRIEYKERQRLMKLAVDVGPIEARDARYDNLEGWPMCFHPRIVDTVQPAYEDCVVLWERWQEAAIDSPPGRSSFCADCTPEYQSREIFHGRCRHPDVTFIADPNEPGAVTGVRAKAV